jgi:hypothetical protein
MAIFRHTENGMDDVALVIGKPFLNTAEFPSRARAPTRGQGPSSTATNARSTRLASVFVSGGVTGEDHPDAFSSSKRRPDRTDLVRALFRLDVYVSPVIHSCCGVSNRARPP